MSTGECVKITHSNVDRLKVSTMMLKVIDLFSHITCLFNVNRLEKDLIVMCYLQMINRIHYLVLYDNFTETFHNKVKSKFNDIV